MDINEFLQRYAEPTDHTDPFVGHTVYLVPIAAILGNMNSIDSDLNRLDLDRSWSDLMDNKRRDESYEEAFHFLATTGFRTPLSIVHDGLDGMVFWNGNHRLTAATDLGYHKIPVVVIETETYGQLDPPDFLWELTEDDYGKVLHHEQVGRQAASRVAAA